MLFRGRSERCPLTYARRLWAGSCGVAFTCRISDFSGPPQAELHLKDLWLSRCDPAAKEFA
jgi:hypothetical protein